MSDPQLIDLNSAAVGIERQVSGIAAPSTAISTSSESHPFSVLNGWIATTWNNVSNPGAFAVAAAEEQEGGVASRHRLPALVWSSA